MNEDLKNDLLELRDFLQQRRDSAARRVGHKTRGPEWVAKQAGKRDAYKCALAEIEDLLYFNDVEDK